MNMIEWFQDGRGDDVAADFDVTECVSDLVEIYTITGKMPTNEQVGLAFMPLWNEYVDKYIQDRGRDCYEENAAQCASDIIDSSEAAAQRRGL